MLSSQFYCPIQSFTDHVISTTYVHKTTWLLSSLVIPGGGACLFRVHRIHIQGCKCDFLNSQFPLSQHEIRSWCYWVSTHLFIPLLTAVISFGKEINNNKKSSVHSIHLHISLTVYSIVKCFLAKVGCLSYVFTHIFTFLSLSPHTSSISRHISFDLLLKKIDWRWSSSHCGGLCGSYPHHSRPTIIGKFGSPVYSHAYSYVTTRT